MEGNTTRVTKVVIRGPQKDSGEEKPSKGAELLDDAMVIQFVQKKGLKVIIYMDLWAVIWPVCQGPRRFGRSETRRSEIEADGCTYGVGTKCKDLWPLGKHMRHETITEQPSRQNDLTS